MAIKGDKQFSVIFDNRKRKSIALDFNSLIPVKKGFSLYLDYMDKHPELKIKDPEFDSCCDELIKHGVIS